MAYAAPKLLKLFSFTDSPDFTLDDLFEAEKAGKIPNFTGRRKSSWTLPQIGAIGEQFGFLAKPQKPVVITSFITKGGVLKSTLVLNLARMAALHNIKTCVVGLDMQGDITAALGCQQDLENASDLHEALTQLSAIRGLPEVMFQKSSPLDLIVETDIPQLSLIPETPELVALEQSLTLKIRREFWLKENVIEPLKQEFDLIVLDASPNWNQLITNALAASDLLLSPLECKINNFRNLKMFQSFIAEFKHDLQLQFDHFYIPTRFSEQRKLSREIFDWYQSHLDNCSSIPIRESVAGEEASALNQSIPEYSPSSPVALEMNSILKMIWNRPVFRMAEGQKSKMLSEGGSYGAFVE
ncbi:MAG: ParA family protein [Bdellovibrionales bacterium]|nr:ParA family protein [Bdellovibrionales bacterium]